MLSIGPYKCVCVCVCVCVFGRKVSERRGIKGTVYETYLTSGAVQQGEGARRTTVLGTGSCRQGFAKVGDAR
jgi:hypothetical protein